MSEFTFRNPQHLTLVTSDFLKAHPEMKDRLKRYYSISADGPVDPVFKQQVSIAGRIIVPIEVEKIEELNMTVVVAGRQRWKAARALGYTEVPTIQETEDDASNTAIVEVSENLARRNLSPREQGEAYQKLAAAGLNQEQVAKLVGKTAAYISRILTVAEMPPIVHKKIADGVLTTEAAYALKDMGTKNNKQQVAATGKTRSYDAKAVEAAIDALSEEARAVGGSDGKIKVKQANKSKASSLELNRGNWQELAKSPDTPDDYKLLIKVFVGEISIAQCKQLGNEFDFDWLKVIAPVKPPKKEKEPKEAKVKGSKGKKAEPKEDTPDELKALFGE